jgi:glycosyltransferase involved in cell wall biosynthesis
VDSPLLYLLNVSNPDRISSDSGWVFADVLLPALADCGVNVVLASPSPVTDGRVRWLRTQSPLTKYHARFDNDCARLRELLAEANPRIIVANQIEQVPAIRAAMLAAHIDVPVVGYCHYLPFYLDPAGRIVKDPSLDDGGLWQSVVLQFLGGLHACDRVMVHSATALEWLERAADLMSVPIPADVFVVPPARHPVTVAQSGAVRSAAGAGGAAVYNHRLYAHYGTADFVALAARLRCQIWVMDVMGERNDARVGLDPSPEVFRGQLGRLPHVSVLSDNGDRDTYRSILARADFGLAPFRPGCTWSMSVVDCHAMGVPVVAPRMAWMREAIAEDLLFDELSQAAEIADRLLGDDEFWACQSAHAAETTHRLAPELIAEEYLKAVAW